MVDNSDLKRQAQDAAKQARDIGKDVITSHGWSYPIQGIFYTLSHKHVLEIIKSQLVPRLTIAAVVTVILFSTVYVPQAMLMTVFTFNPFGFLSAVPLVLSEANLLTTVLAAFWIQDKSDLIFDQVMMDKGHETLVSRGRDIRTGGSGKNRANLSAVKAKMTSPLAKFSPQAIFRYLLTIPLNFIPAIGTILFLVLNGRRAGPRFLSRYFQLKQLSESAKQKHIDERTGALTSFGITTVLLNLVPMGGQIFQFSNIVGAALLASDLENRGGL